MTGSFVRHPATRFSVLCIAAGALGFAACSRAVAPLESAGESAVALSGGPNTSMIYLARTSEGVLAIDLGWWGSGRALQDALRELDATRDDIAMVFLTHSHRDHIAAWRSVRHAPFYVAAAEYFRLVGDSAHRGWVPRLGDWIKPVQLPRPGELEVRSFAQDTAFIVGSDTLRAYVVAGHTAGTSVYLFRGVLFLGDAVTYSLRRGFAPAKPRVSDNPRLAAENLQLLWPRLPPGDVRYVCTAHAHCAPFSARFLADVAR